MVKHDYSISSGIKDLIRKTKERSSGLTKDSYVNLNKDGTYAGWVCDLGLREKGETKNYSLNLENCLNDSEKEWNLFLLLVMAVAWSRTGQFENAVYIVACFIKNINANAKIDNGILEQAIKIQKTFKSQIKQFDGLKPRKEPCFRKDILASIGVLIKNWANIKSKLQSSDKNWEDFIRYMNHINGLGVKDNRMKIKILLILRELRCQGYKNIPGELCCVPDARVKEAYYALYKEELNTSEIDDVINASKDIYSDFNDLYDIPLFACQDLIIDAHSHISDSHKHLQSCVGTICCCAKYEDLDRIYNINDSRVYKCFGIHPWYIDSLKPDYKDKICDLLSKNKHYCVGEIGLDKNKPDMDSQIEIFKTQLNIAIRFKRTVFVHCVGAWDKMLNILKQTKGLSSIKIVMHAFNGNAEITKQLLVYDNIYFSFNKCMKIIENIPSHRILVETDWDNNKNIDYNYLTNLILEISNIKPNIQNQIYDNTRYVLSSKRAKKYHE